MDITDPEERCLSHARIAARQAVMKGLDPETVADAFMLEAIKLTFGLDDPEAARLVQRWKEQTFRFLDADYVTVSADDGARNIAEMRADRGSDHAPDEADDHQQNDRADGRIDDLPDDTAGRAKSQLRQQETADQRSDDADGDVADQSEPEAAARADAELKSCGGKSTLLLEHRDVCYEYVELISSTRPRSARPAASRAPTRSWVPSSTRFLHEAGHAVFDLLEDSGVRARGRCRRLLLGLCVVEVCARGCGAPVSGRRLHDGERGQGGAGEAAEAWRAYAGPHGTAAQRYYNLLCMAYGSDPKTFADAISKGGLPTERADGCAEEFAMLERAFRKLILPYIDEESLAKARADVRFNWGPLITSTSGLDALPLAE